MTRGQILPPREVKPAAAAATNTNDEEDDDEDFVFIGKGKAVKARDDDDDGASSSSGSSGGVRLSKTDEPEEGEKFPEYGTFNLTYPKATFPSPSVQFNYPNSRITEYN